MIRPSVQHQRSTWYSILVSLFVATALHGYNEMTIGHLPADEREAQEALEDGTLDSALWNEIRQFYTAPINVPAGELALLQEIFFSFTEELPVSEAKLAAYRPWGEKERKRFLETYPELEPFLPLLSFQAPVPGPFPAQTSFSFSRYGTSDTSRQYAHFSTGSGRTLQTCGRVDFSDSYGRWQRRGLSFSPQKDIRFELGNYTAGLRQKLFLGYFPGANEADTMPVTSWFYPSARTWNGVRISGQRTGDGHRMSGEASLHDRPSERTVTTEGTIGFGRRLSLTAGGAYLRMMDTPDDPGHFYAHGALSCVLAKGWNSSVLAGVAADQPRNVPFIAAISNQNERFRVRATVTGLPRGFFAPRSYLAHSARQWGMEFDTLREDLLSASVSCTHRYSPSFSITPEVNTVFLSHNLGYIRTSLGCRGSLPFSYRLRYTWTPPVDHATDESARHLASGSVSFTLGSRLGCEITNASALSPGGYWRSRTVIAPEILLSREMAVSPLASVSANAAKLPEQSLGLRQVMTIGEKTFSVFTIEQNLPFDSLERLRVYGTMSFAL